MKLLVVGATGRTGRQVVTQALARGHEVKALARHKGALAAHERLRTIVGSATAARDLHPAVVGCDAIVSCLGQRSQEDATLLRDAAAAMLEALDRDKTTPYLVVSQGLLFASRNPFIALLRFILRRHVADSAAMEARVRSSAAAWVIVRPPRLIKGAARGYRTRRDARPSGASIRFADLAAFLVDEAEQPQHLRAVVGVSSA